MVAIFTGAGAGFTRGSANILGGAGQLGGGLLGRGGENVAVNAATGNLLISHQDEFLVGRGPDVGIARTHNSIADAADGDNGDQWQQSTTRRVFGLTGTINTAGSTISRLGADGAVVVYGWNEARAAYVTTEGDGAHDQLTFAGDVWTWRDGGTQATESYAAHGADNWRIATASDIDGNTLSWSYAGDKLDKVTTADGAWVQYIWAGNNISQVVTGYTNLATLASSTLTRTRYAYDASDRLILVTTDLSPENNSVANGKVYTVSYTYDGTSNRIASIGQTDGSLLAIAYDANGRVQTLTQTVASGDTRVTTLSYGAGLTDITGPDGQVTRLDYDGFNRLTRIVAPPAQAGAAAQQVQFSYDAQGNVASVTDGNGETTTYQYDANGNVTHIADANGNTVQKTYDSANRLITEFAYGSDESGPSSAQYAQYAYDAEGHLRYAVNGAGQVTEYDYTAAGELARMVEYPAHPYPVGPAPIGEAGMDAWVAGLGDLKTAKVTEYAYDVRGSLTSTRAFRFADASGAGDPARPFTRSHFTYDQAGRLLSRHHEGENAESFVYDGLGRLVASTDLAGGATTIVFNDAALKTTVTTASGYTSVSTYNRAGELVSRLDSGAHTVGGNTIYAYDKNGQLRVVTDATGRKSYFVYDRAGRKVADVNHLGEMVEYRYDKADRVVALARYTTALDAGDLALLSNPDGGVQLSAIRPASNASDLWSWTIYDDGGRVIQTIAGDGSVASYAYDGSDRLVRTTAYYNRLSAAQLNTLRNTPPSAPVLPSANTRDVASRQFYDKAGQLVGVLDGEGYLTEHVYDAAGQKVEEIAYATRTGSSLWSSGSFSQLRASATSASATDGHSYFLYNGAGELTYVVNAQGGVTSFNRDYAGKLIATRQFANLIMASEMTYEKVGAAISHNPNQDRSESTIYDATGRVRYIVDGEQRVTAYSYDAAGRVVKSVQFAAIANVGAALGALDNWAANAAQTGNAANRITRNWYSERGELLYTVDGEGHVRGFTYDAEGRKLGETAWPNKVTVTDGTTLSQIASFASGSGSPITLSFSYDNAGRLLTSTDGEGFVTRHVYNALGQLSDIYRADNVAGAKVRTHYEYDGAGRLVAEYQAYGQPGQVGSFYAYDGLGNRISATDANGNVTTYSYDERGLLLTATDARGGVVAYEYDGFGNVVKVTDPRGKSTRTFYDNLSRVIAVLDPENYLTKNFYNAFGEIREVRTYQNETTDPAQLIFASPEVENALAIEIEETRAALSAARIRRDDLREKLEAVQPVLAAALEAPLPFLQAEIDRLNVELAALQAQYDALPPYGYYLERNELEEDIEDVEREIGDVRGQITRFQNGQALTSLGNEIVARGAGAAFANAWAASLQPAATAANAQLAAAEAEMAVALADPLSYLQQALQELEDKLEGLERMPYSQSKGRQIDDVEEQIADLEDEIARVQNAQPLSDFGIALVEARVARITELAAYEDVLAAQLAALEANLAAAQADLDAARQVAVNAALSSSGLAAASYLQNRKADLQDQLARLQAKRQKATSSQTRDALDAQINAQQNNISAVQAEINRAQNNQVLTALGLGIVDAEFLHSAKLRVLADQLSAALLQPLPYLQARLAALNAELALRQAEYNAMPSNPATLERRLLSIEIQVLEDEVAALASEIQRVQNGQSPTSLGRKIVNKAFDQQASLIANEDADVLGEGLQVIDAAKAAALANPLPHLQAHRSELSAQRSILQAQRNAAPFGSAERYALGQQIDALDALIDDVDDEIRDIQIFNRPLSQTGVAIIESTFADLYAPFQDIAEFQAIVDARALDVAAAPMASLDEWLGDPEFAFETLQAYLAADLAKLEQEYEDNWYHGSGYNGYGESDLEDRIEQLEYYIEYVELQISRVLGGRLENFLPIHLQSLNQDLSDLQAELAATPQHQSNTRDLLQRQIALVQARIAQVGADIQQGTAGDALSYLDQYLDALTTSRAATQQQYDQTPYYQTTTRANLNRQIQAYDAIIDQVEIDIQFAHGRYSFSGLGDQLVTEAFRRFGYEAADIGARLEEALADPIPYLTARIHELEDEIAALQVQYDNAPSHQRMRIGFDIRDVEWEVERWESAIREFETRSTLPVFAQEFIEAKFAPEAVFHIDNTRLQAALAQIAIDRALAGAQALGEFASIRALQTSASNAQSTLTRLSQDLQELLANEDNDPFASARTSFEYDRRGLLVGRTDAEGYRETYAYNAFGQRVSLTRLDPAGAQNAAQTSFEYDERGQLIKVTDAEGYFETFAYDAYGNRVAATAKSWTDAVQAGGTTTYVYDKRGLLLSETLPVKSYTSAGVEQSLPVRNSYTYDARGNLIARTEAVGLPEERVTTYAYDMLDRLVETKGESVSGFRIDLATRAVAAESGQPTETIAYDARGNIIKTVDAAGAATVFFYDQLNRKVVEINALGTYTAYGYDANGNVLSVTVYENTVTVPATGGAQASAPAAPGGAARTTSFTYDDLGRMLTSSVNGVTAGEVSGASWASQANQSLITQYAYDYQGNVAKVTAPNGAVTWSYYDKLGRKIAQVDGENYRTDWSYDAEGNVTQERRYANRAVIPDNIFNPPAVTEDAAKDRITQYTYDRNGNRLSESRLNVQVHDGNGGYFSGVPRIDYRYNGLGQVVSREEATGETTYFTYDAGGRLRREAKYHSAADYFYDGLGNLVRGEQGSVDGSVKRATRYSYGAGGRLASVTVGSGAEAETRYYEYDRAGRLTLEYYDRQSMAANGATQIVREAIGYRCDLLGRNRGQGYYVGSGGAWAFQASNDYSSMEYNAFGEVTRIGINGLWQQENRYDAAGRVWASNAGDGVWKYFGYDKAGNQTLAVTSAGASLAGVASIQNAYAAVGQANVNGTLTAYDKRGQAIRVIEEGRELGASTADLVSLRSYNAFGEVASETDAQGGVTDYTYNTMGRLITVERPLVQVVDEAGSAVDARPTERFYHDASGRVTGQRDANGNLTRFGFFAGSGFGGAAPLIAQEIHADGTVHTEYNVFGEATKITDETGVATLLSYDSKGRLIQTVEIGSGLTDSYAYDILGQRISHYNSVLGAANKEITQYDMQGRIVAQRAFGGDVTTTSYSWDSGIATAGMGTFGGWTIAIGYANGRSLTEQEDMFGRTISRNDLGSNATAFTYDAAGRLLSTVTTPPTSSPGTGTASNSYLYYNTGLLKQAKTSTKYEYYFNFGAGIQSNVISETYADYTYDTLGNRKTEVGSKRQTVNGTTTSPEVWKNQSASYDALGRLIQWTEVGTASSPAANITYSYDAAGNVRHSVANFRKINTDGTVGAASIQDYWFRYDSRNRLVIDRGVLSGAAGASGTTIVRNMNDGASKEIGYDAAGRRVSIVSYQKTGAIQYREQREIYGYDAAGRLSRVDVTNGASVTMPGSASAIPTAPTATGAATRRASFTYDALGRLKQQQDYEANGTTIAYSRDITYNASNQIQSETATTKQGSDTYTATSTYNYGSGASSALGSVVSMSTTNKKNGASQTGSTTTYSYDWREGAVQSGIQLVQGSNTTITSYRFDAAGRLTSASINDGKPRTVTYRMDENGQIIRRDESRPSNAPSGQTGSPHEVWYRFAGKELGYAGNNGTLDKDYAASIADRQIVPPSNAGTYRNGQLGAVDHADFAQSYDPVNSYSQGASGGSYTVRPGDSLQSIAQAVWGDANLWYKLAEANGLTGQAGLIEGQVLLLPAGVVKNTHNAGTLQPYDPAEAVGNLSPTTPKPPKKKGGCGGLGQILLVAVAVAVTLVVKAPVTGFLGGSPVVGGAASAAIGSVASQSVGVATGLQDKFSFKGVALAAIGGGVGGALSGINLPDGALGGATNFASDVVRGVLGNGITQGIALATGLQSKFDFASVAAAGVGAGIGGEFARGLAKTGGFFATGIGNDLGSTMASTIAYAATRSSITGEGFGDNLMRGLPDALGQTLGRALGGAANSALAEAAQRNSQGAGNPVGEGIATIGNGYAEVLTGELGVMAKPQADGFRIRSDQPYLDYGVNLSAGEMWDRGLGLLQSGWEWLQAQGQELHDDAIVVIGRVDNSLDWAIRQATENINPQLQGNLVTHAANIAADRLNYLGYQTASRQAYALGQVPVGFLQRGVNLASGTLSGARSLLFHPGQTLKGAVDSFGAGFDQVVMASPGDVGRAVTGTVGRTSATVALAASGNSAAARQVGAMGFDVATLAAPAIRVAAGRSVANVVVAERAPSIEALYQARYAAAYERGLAKVDAELAVGEIRAPIGQPEHLFRANQVDDFARRDLRAFALEQGHGIDLVRINQRLYLEGTSGPYRIPDLYFPQSGTILDGTLGFKSAQTPQIMDFRAANNNAPIGIVRPESYGGFYWIGK